MAVDYDDRLHRVYAAGRRLTPDGLRRWLDEFARWAPPERPLAVLDLGSGTGRFTPALADVFGGPVYGVEPSARMRAIAETDAVHPAVTYLDGAAEAIPLDDGCCDLALLFLTFHHFRDPAAALSELVRVLRPGGVVLLRSQFRDRVPDLHWYRYFPSAREVDAGMYPSLAEFRRLAATAGLVADPDLAGLPARGIERLRDVYDRVSLRALSTFEHIPAHEQETGFEAFRRDAEANPDLQVPEVRADLLVLRRSGPAGHHIPAPLRPERPDHA
jgi:ubiquinone/menaquinone biosynthesis C-methylase UbiE